MEEKENALNQLKQINAVINDSSKFVPFDGNILIIWAIVGSVMLYFGPGVFYDSILYGSLFLVCGFLIGFTFEYFLVKNANKKVDLDIFTPIQKSIEVFYATSAVFGILLTVIFFKAGMSALIFPMWLFFIGMPGLISGFLVHCNSFKAVSLFTLFLSFSLLLYISFNIELINDDILTNNLKLLTIFVFTSSYIYLGTTINKKCKIV